MVPGPALFCWCYKTQNGALCPCRVPTNINETETVPVQVGMEVANGKVLAGSRQHQKENREHGGTAILEASLIPELTAAPVPGVMPVLVPVVAKFPHDHDKGLSVPEAGSGPSMRSATSQARSGSTA